MEIRTLNYFLEAADALNFTRAAKNCFVTQAAMSLAISKLEQELGVALFDRNHKSIRLTHAGEEFRKWAKDAYRSYESTVTRCREIEQGDRGHLHVGVNSYFDGLYMQGLLSSLNCGAGKIDVNVRMNSVQGLLPALRNRRIDAFLCPPYGYENQADLRVDLLESFDLVLIMSQDHPLVRYETVPTATLRDYDALILTYQGLADAETEFLKLLSDSGIAFKRLIQMNHIEEVLMNLPNSEKTALLPSFIFRMSGQAFTSRPIEGRGKTIPFALISLADTRNPVIGALGQALQRRPR